MDELREKVARVIDPALAALLDRGHLNQWGHENWQAVLMKADAILNLIGGDGWKLVPRDPSTKMMFAGSEALVEAYCDNRDWESAKDAIENLDPADIYRAMIAASPPPKDTP